MLGYAKELMAIIVPNKLSTCPTISIDISSLLGILDTQMYNTLMSTFLARLAEPRPILLDGATGSELQRRGVDTTLPLWSARALIDAPEVLLQIHKEYLQAGAEVLTSNTFRTHRRSLARAGIEDRFEELSGMAVEIARSAINLHNQGGWIAGSIAPLEDCYSPEMVPPQEECLNEHTQMAQTLAQAGVDFLLIETMNTVREAEAAAWAAQNTSLPFGVSFVCREDGNLFSGESLLEAVKVIEKFNPAFIGINCTPSATISKALSKLDCSTNLPLGIYANIGHTDEIDGWENTDNVSPEGYGELARTWLQHNPALVGGCCGTTPEHIGNLHKLIDSLFSQSEEERAYAKHH